jgi:hypothetical protein
MHDLSLGKEGTREAEGTDPFSEITIFHSWCRKGLVESTDFFENLLTYSEVA